ncbi:MAG: site-specific DNA-methyltransferase [Bacteroidaceae bacterium]|nr:site-specific DNA-methyltransferase [Bacteroidaceae bacterium]
MFNEERNEYVTDRYALYKGDTCELIRNIPDNSIHLSIYSPPFLNLYCYSNSDRDLGNSRNDDEFFAHFDFIVKELYRILMPGRIMAVHCMNIPAMKERDGYIGIKDFRGDLIRCFQKHGFIYHSEVTIWKNPVTEMQRTKALGLLHKQIKKDSSKSRMGMPDYIVFMRKQGDNPEPITHTNESYPVSLWQNVASPAWELTPPVWNDINQSNTLNRMFSDEESEKHIAPLQLDVIERIVKLYSNPDDVVFTPFMGIGSEVYQSAKMGRRAIGIELKDAYFEQAVKNMNSLEDEQAQTSIFDFLRTKEGE